MPNVVMFLAAAAAAAAALHVGLAHNSSRSPWTCLASATNVPFSDLMTHCMSGLRGAHSQVSDQDYMSHTHTHTPPPPPPPPPHVSPPFVRTKIIFEERNSQGNIQSAIHWELRCVNRCNWSCCVLILHQSHGNTYTRQVKGLRASAEQASRRSLRWQRTPWRSPGAAIPCPLATGSLARCAALFRYIGQQWRDACTGSQQACMAGRLRLHQEIDPFPACCCRGKVEHGRKQ